MVSYDLGDILVLYLDGVDGKDSNPATRERSNGDDSGGAATRERSNGDDSGGAATRERSIAGICEALDYDEGAVADRVALLSALDELKGDELLVESQRPVEGFAGERNVYSLTDRGRQRADTLRERLSSERVVIRDAAGEETNVSLGDIDEHFPEPALPRALARMTDDDVVLPDQDVEEGFVNRVSELDALESALEGASDGDGGAVLVAGEPGVGKTMLVTEAFGETARDRGFDLVVGQCRRDTSTPYDPFRTILAEIDGENGGFPSDVAGAELDDPGQLELQRAALFDAVLDRIVGASRETPLVLVVEDLHVADEPTVALFSHLADHLEGAALLIGTYRPTDTATDAILTDLAADWMAADEDVVHRYHLDVQPFDRDVTRRLIESVVGQRGVPDAFVELLYEHTGGNALFVEGSVRGLLEDGDVDPEHEIYPEVADDLPLPGRVEAVVDSRLATFDEVARTTLEIGAAIGEAVPVDVLSTVVDAELDVDDRTLTRYLDVFEDGNLWTRIDDDTVRFASGVVRERILERIDDDRRPRLHGLIADAITDEGGDDPDRQATVAYHLEQSGQYQEAFDRRLEAADRAIEVYAHELALENYDRALRLSRERLGRDAEENVEILQSIAEVYYLRGEYDDADRYFEYAADRVSDPEQGRRIARLRADMQSSRGRHDRELELCQEAFETYGSDNTLESALLYGRMGGAHQGRSEIDQAAQCYQQCWEIAQATDDPTALAAACLNFASLDYSRGEIDQETVDRLERGIDAAEESEDDRSLARALNNLAMVQTERYEFEAAERSQRRCIEVQERMGDGAALVDSISNLGIILMMRGDLDAAIAAFEDALGTAEEIQFDRLVARSLLLLGNARHQRGALDRAREHAARAESIVPETAAELPANLAHLRALLHLDCGEFSEAVDVTRELRTELQETSFTTLAGSVLVTNGDALFELGELDQSADLYDQVLADIDRDGFDSESVLSDAHCGLARCRLERGDAETALDRARQACDLVENHPERSEARIRATTTLGVCHRAVGDDESAVEHLSDALEAARESGRAVEEWEVLCELGRIEDGSTSVETGETARGKALDAASEAGAERIARRCRQPE